MPGTVGTGQLLRLNSGRHHAARSGRHGPCHCGRPRGRTGDWDGIPQSGILWIADDDRAQAAHMSGLTMSAPPVRARLFAAASPCAPASGRSRSIRATRSRPSVTIAFIASTEGYISSGAVCGGRGPDECSSLQNGCWTNVSVRCKSSRSVLTALFYFCTDTALGAARSESVIRGHAGFAAAAGAAALRAREGRG